MNNIGSTSGELYRRIILVLAILAGMAMIGYKVPAGDIYYPCRSMGIMILAAGIILANVLPRRRPEVGDLSYGWSAINVIDFTGIVLLLVFYSLPISINGGWNQVFNRGWFLTIIFWLLGAVGVFIIYTSAWNASYCLKFRPDSLVRITFKGVERCYYDEIDSLEEAALVYPLWLCKLYGLTRLLAVVSGRGAPPSPASFSAVKNACHAGLLIRRKDGKQLLIWYSDRYGIATLSGYEQVIKECQDQNIPYHRELTIMTGFLYFK